MDKKNIIIFILVIVVIILASALISGALVSKPDNNDDINITNNVTNNTTGNSSENVAETTITKDTSSVKSQHTVKQESQKSSNSSDIGPDVDSSGITREVANKYGYTYTEEHGGHYIGYNDAWDEENQCYHD